MADHLRYLFITSGCLKKNSSFVRLAKLGENLSNYGICVSYLCDDTKYNRSLQSKLKFSQFYFVSISYERNIFSYLLTSFHLSKHIPADVVHFLNPSVINIVRVLSYNCLVVSDFDELLSVRAQSWMKRKTHFLCEIIARYKSSLTVVSSRHLQKYFLDHFNLGSLYLPYATYLQDVEKGSYPFLKPTAVYMGNFHYDGDYDILINAWTILEAQDKAPDLHLIGGGPCLEAVKAEVAARGLNTITIKGYLPVEEMWTSLCYAHILLFPIRNTLGNRMRCPSKTFAYMQASRPIVTNRVGEVEEALGNQAIYVEPTPEDFAQAVAELFNHPLSDVLYDLDSHTWESRAKDLLNVINTFS